MRKAFIIAAVTILIVAAAIVFTFDPEGNMWFPKCPVYLLTGYSCPGCGTGRALYHLLHLRISTAIGYNPIIAVALPYVSLLLYMEYAGGKRRFPKIYSTFTNRIAIYTILAVIMIYTVLRNIF